MEVVLVSGFLLFLGVGCLGGIAFLATYAGQRQRLERLEQLVRRLDRPVRDAGLSQVGTRPVNAETEKPGEASARVVPPSPARSRSVAATPLASDGEAPVEGKPHDAPATVGVAEIRRPPRRSGNIGSTERIIGTRYLAWSGAIILVLGVAYFLRYAYDVGLVGPSGRLAIGALFGTSLMAAARTRRVRELKAWAAIATGVGIAIYYACVYFAFEIYGVWGPATAFVAASGVTAFALILALKDDEVGVAALGILGGFISPIVISIDPGQPWHLLAYVTVLDLFALGLAVFRRWRIVDALALAGTVALAWIWGVREFDVGDAAFAATGISLLWIGFVVMVVLRGLREREGMRVETLMTAVVASGAASVAWALALEPHDVARLALPAAAAMLLIGLGELVRRRLPDLPLGYRALRFQALSTIAAAVGAAAGLEVLVLVTALQAIVCAAVRGAWSPTDEGRRAAYALGPILFVLHGVSAVALLPWDATSATLFNAQYLSAVVVSLACLASGFLGRRSDDGEESPMGLVLFFGIATLCLATHLELGRVLGSDAIGLELVAVAAVWSVGLAMATIAAGVTRSRFLAICTAVMAVGAAVSVLAVAAVYPESREPFFLNPRISAAIMLAAALFFLRRRLSGFPLSVPTRQSLSGVMLFMGSSAVLLAILQDIGMFSASRRLANEWPLGGGLLLLSVAALAINRVSRRHESGAGVAYGVVLRAFATIQAVRCLVDWSGDDVLFLDWFTFVLTVYVVSSCLERHAHEGRTALAMPTQLVAFFALFVEIESWAAQSTSDLWFVGEVSPSLGRGLISAVWALQAFVLIAVGLRARRRELRVLGFLVFAVVAGKVLLFDLEFLDKVYRVLSFVGTGVLLLGGSYLYHAVGRGGEGEQEPATSAG